MQPGEWSGRRWGDVARPFVSSGTVCINVEDGQARMQMETNKGDSHDRDTAAKRDLHLQADKSKSIVIAPRHRIHENA